MIIPPEIMITKSLHPEDEKILDEIESEEKLIYSQKSSFNGAIKVVENRLGRFLKLEDSYQSAKIETPLYRGNIPYTNYFFLAPSVRNNIKKVLVVGLGAGYFINQLQSIMPQVEKIDVVEINPELSDIAEEYFGFDPSGININIQEGRLFVKYCREKYDLIILDVFSETGIAYRFMTREFLEEIDKILSSDGVLVSNVFGLVDINAENNVIFKSLLKTYNSVFEENLVFPTNYGNYEFYRTLMGFEHDLSNLTNVIIFSSREEICFNVGKILRIQEKLNLNLDKYVQDFYIDDINLEKVKILLDEYEYNPDFNPRGELYFHSLKSFLTKYFI